MTIEQEIRDCYARMGVELATEENPFYGKGWIAQSQYGYDITHKSGRKINENFDTKEEAEQFVINYYSDKMNLIRQ